MDYDETIDYLFTRLPMYSRIGAAAFKEDITNTVKLCKFLGEPQQKLRTIHVAGTNGKGSTSHMLAAILQTAGYKTGLYTSPHLKDFRERIRINGEMISKEKVTSFVGRVQPIIPVIEPSFFEITVGMAFDHFAEEEVDIAVIEVGLGGRFDSTNIITPEVSVITNIGFDHMNLLGNTLQKIAFEKAGIIKPGIPVVVGEFQPETNSVFEKKAASVHAPLTFADKVRFVAEWSAGKHELIAEVTSTHANDKESFILDLTGIYQLKNLVTVLEAIHVLRQQGWGISLQHIKNALQHVKKLTSLHGRWEVVHESPLIVLDVGHNEDGILQLTRQLELTDHEELHIVIGLVKDKEAEKILGLLPKYANYYFCKAGIPRALPETELATKGKQAGLNGNAYADVNTALQAAVSHAGDRDLIVVCGSLFIVGEVDLNAIKNLGKVRD